MFYTFDQNNSGGRYVLDDKVGHVVVIEAEDADVANEMFFNTLSLNYGGYCECCGERWSHQWHNDEGTKEPSQYGKSFDVPKEHDPTSVFDDNDSYGYVYYESGNKVKFKL